MGLCAAHHAWPEHWGLYSRAVWSTARGAGDSGAAARRLGKRSPSASLNSLMEEPGYRMYLQLIQAGPRRVETLNPEPPQRVRRLPRLPPHVLPLAPLLWTACTGVGPLHAGWADVQAVA